MAAPWDGSSSALQHYKQKYSYDEAGNILELQHIAAVGSYTRSYSYSSTSSRLQSTRIGGGSSYSYSHEARGNMVAMPHLSVMDYDLQNQMHHVTAATVEANYQYSGGQRVKKFLDKGGGITEERIYYGSYEVYRKWTGTTLNLERTTLHVVDDAGRIAMREKRTQGSDVSLSRLKRYIYSNHLQSASLELDDVGDIISYEEYHPYGTNAYQAINASIKAVAKRYRYTGKERDEESGLNYHGARYYAPWLCRWVSVDLLENEYPELSPYNYCVNNPIIYVDTDGKKIYHYALLVTEGKAPVLSYIGAQTHEFAWWEFKDKGTMHFQTANGTEIKQDSLQVHIIYAKGNWIANAPTQTFSNLKELQAWSKGGYKGLEAFNKQHEDFQKMVLYATLEQQMGAGHSDMSTTSHPENETLPITAKRTATAPHDGHTPASKSAKPNPSKVQNPRFKKLTTQEAAETFGGAKAGKKPMGIPSLNRIKFDWVHIMENHADWGKVAKQPGNKKDIFEGLSEAQIKEVVKGAYQNVYKHYKSATQEEITVMRGKYQSWDVEFYVNRKTKTVETAYPKRR